jgi:hypothetical protein
MSYTGGTPIIGEGKGDPDKIADWAIANGAQRPDELRDYLDTVYRMAPALGLNPDVVVGQSHLETGGWNSLWWNTRLNPAGIGVTGDARQDAISRVFSNGEAAALGHMLHLYLYTVGDDIPSGFSVNDDPRRLEAIEAGYVGFADVLDNLTNTWAVDDQYGAKIAARMNLMEAAGLLGATGDTKPEAPVATHRYILSAGHRNTNGGGARNEINWTYPSVVALKDAIEDRGGKAWIVQQEDGDGDASRYVNGGLQQAASTCVKLASKYGPFDAYISSHYNGGASPGFHAIFPDAPTGGVDVKANNPLDVRLCRTIRDRVKATNTVRMLSWTADSPGVMSERETGVGAKGYRLGEMYGTMGFRDRTARVIIEASSIDVASEARYINDPKWVRDVYCEAVVDALEDVFGKFREGPVEQPPGPEEPEIPNIPKPEYATADPIEQVADLPPYVKLPNGAQMVRVDHTVKAVKNTPRLQYADPASPRVGPDVPAGSLFDVRYLIINTDGSLYWYSPWATRFRFEDAVPDVAEVDDTPEEQAA